MVGIEHLDFHIGGSAILNDVSLDLPQGGITALIGPNGAGKSTLFSLMSRLTPLQRGTVHYSGKNLAATPDAELARVLSILTQDNQVHSRITVRELLMFGRYPHHQGRPGKKDHEVVEQMLDEFSLHTLSERYLSALSGGQKQRAMIAMVFCQGTDYVLLDEPLNNLDMHHARNLMQLLKRLTHEQHRTTIAVLHDINQAAAYADYVVAMQNGRVRFCGTPDEVFTADHIRSLFEIDVDVIEHKGKKLVVHHI